VIYLLVKDGKKKKRLGQYSYVDSAPLFQGSVKGWVTAKARHSCHVPQEQQVCRQGNKANPAANFSFRFSYKGGKGRCKGRERKKVVSLMAMRDKEAGEGKKMNERWRGGADNNKTKNKRRGGE
jgi:hypothetical protein